MKRIYWIVCAVAAVPVALKLAGLIAWGGWVLAIDSWRVREYAEGIVQFPIYPSKFALAVGATLMTLQTLVDLVSALKRADRPD